jgi:hypothetical protein
MNGTSGFQAGCGRLRRARLAGKARRARIRVRRLKTEERKLRTQNSARASFLSVPPIPHSSFITHHSQLRTQNPELKTQNFRSRTPNRAYQFLHKQWHRLGLSSWHVLSAHDLITRITGSSTREERFLVPLLSQQSQLSTQSRMITRTD